MAQDQQSTAPTSALSRVLRKKNGRKKRRDSTASSVRSASSDGPTHRGLRSSLEQAVEKVKHHVGSGNTDEVNGDESGSKIPFVHGRISKLLPKLRKTEDQTTGVIGHDEGDVDRSPSLHLSSSTDATEPEEHRPLARHSSYSDGSLMTIDTDEDSMNRATAPTLASRPSHAGYLTISSPLIKSATSDLGEVDAESTEPGLIESNDTAPSSSSDTPPRLHSESLRADSGKKSIARSRSPAGRFREVFKTTPSRRATSPSPSPSPSRGPLDTGNGLSSLFGSRKGSGASHSRRGSKVGQPRQASPDKQSADTDQHSNIALTRPPSQPINTLIHAQTSPPLTTITPPTPVNPSSDFLTPLGSPHHSLDEGATSATVGNEGPDIVTSPSGRMISHRRARSSPLNQPQNLSKLSHTVAPPLSPTLEESRTPSGSLGPPNTSNSQSQQGFFSTVLSAAQTAANTLSSSITNSSLTPGAPRARSATLSGELSKDESPKEEVISSFPDPEGSADSQTTDRSTKRPAVETLGFGDLSLSHLGIVDAGIDEPEGLKVDSTDTMSDGTAAPGASTASHALHSGDRPVTPGRGDTVSSIESPKDEVGRAGTPAQFNGSRIGASHGRSVVEHTKTPFAEDTGSNSRARSTNEHSIAGDQTPPNAEHETESLIKRSGSVRSKVGAVTRRKRGSSAATGTTIAAAIGATNAALGHTTSSGIAPRLTGFAVASKKRNRDFHQLFRSVPEDDYLIEDYSAALQREILLHGRLYISEGHICFYANIFGWVTNLVISFDEVVSLEKKTTAMVFPNAIVISTLHARNVFASFVSRDSTYDLLVGIWKISHPNLKSSVNGVSLDDTKGADKTVKAEDSESGVSSGEDEEEDDDDIYDEDADGEDGMGSLMTAGDGSVAGSEHVGESAENHGRTSRKVSNLPQSQNSSHANNVGGDARAVDGNDSVSGSPAGDFPGPATHAPTTCTDQPSHYERAIKDEVVAAPLGKVYNLMFGPASGAFMSKWLVEDQKVLDLQMEDDKKGLSEGNKTRNYSYIKPLNASIGPKQTKCIITENLDMLDLERSVSVTVSTQTPDVPSGNVFSVKTRYCLTWAEGNGTRIVMNCAIEWTGKSWLKGPIEKGANDGQQSYAADLMEAMKNASRTRVARRKNETKTTKTKSRVAPVVKTETKIVEKKDDRSIMEYRVIIGAVIGIVVGIIIGWLFSGRDRDGIEREVQDLYEWIG